MYLVLAEKFPEAKKNSPPLVSTEKIPKKPPHPPPSKKNKKKRTRREKQHPYDRWVKFPKNMGETDITRKTRMNATADFYRKSYLNTNPPVLKVS
jgi:hypothetical protein